MSGVGEESPDRSTRRIVAAAAPPIEEGAWFRLVGRGPAATEAGFRGLIGMLFNWFVAHRRSGLPSFFFVALDDGVMRLLDVRFDAGHPSIEVLREYELHRLRLVGFVGGWDITFRGDDGRVVSMTAAHESPLASSTLTMLRARLGRRAGDW